MLGSANPSIWSIGLSRIAFEDFHFIFTTTTPRVGTSTQTNVLPGN